MSYIVYINGEKIETYNNYFALTRQNNDIADISNRNADFSENIKIPKTSKNISVLETAGLIGRNSEIPYKKNIVEIVDADTGTHIVKNGYAVLINTEEKEYNLSVFSGNINFFKAIENLTLTEVGISDLNHIKDLTNVKDTWTNNTLPYRYIIADYNGKYLTTGNRVNIDYQVPSASVKYLWERIFNYIDFQYEGAIFTNEEFIDLWLTYPKPVPRIAPVFQLISNQNSLIVQQYFYDGNALINRYGINLLPYSITGTNINTIGNIQKIVTGGTYKIELSGSVYSPWNNQTYDSVIFRLFDNLGVLIQENTINSGQNIVFTASVDYTFILISEAYSQINSLTGGFTTIINKVVGYTLGFDQAFIDFKVSDFIKEILIRFALTPFTIPNSNKVKFLTLDEIFQNPNIQDWTNKFHGVTNESYVLSRYAQNNLLKFKYNDENQNHNDANLKVKNENIKEEVTLFSSRIFSPNKKESEIGKVYTIWEKNIKDNNTVEYKELENRFYFLRSEKINSEIEIGSDFLNSHINSSFFYKENYYKCSWRELVNTWYRNINKLLDFTKVITANIYIKPYEYSQIKMYEMVFINQLGSYFLINKISNFIPKKNTKVELIKVEYFSEPIEILPTEPYININSYTITSCNITFNLSTNLINGQILNLKLYFAGVDINTYAPVTALLTSNSVTFSLTSFNVPLNFSIDAKISGNNNVFNTFETTFYNIGSFNTSCYVPLNLPSTITLINHIYQGAKIFTLYYDYSTIAPQTQYIVKAEAYLLNAFTIGGQTLNVGWHEFNAETKETNNIMFLEQKQINIILKYYGLDVFEINQFSKFRIKINNTYSNEINI